MGYDGAVLTNATQTKLGEIGKRDASFVLKEITTTPKKATKYRKVFSHDQQRNTTATQLIPTQVLSMIVEADLSRRQYEIVRNTNKIMYPCYSALQKAKQECYPETESYWVTEMWMKNYRMRMVDYSPPDFRMWGSCRTMPLVGVFSRGYPVFLVPSVAASYSPRFTLIDSQNLDRWERWCYGHAQMRIAIDKTFAAIGDVLLESSAQLAKVQCDYVGGRYWDNVRHCVATATEPPSRSHVLRLLSPYSFSVKYWCKWLDIGNSSCNLCSRLETRRSYWEHGAVPYPVFCVLNEYGAAPEGKGRETGDLRENPPTNGIVLHNSRMRKSGVTRPGIQPGSPCGWANRPETHNLLLGVLLVKAVHDKVNTSEMNLRKISLPLPAYILTGELTDMRPLKLETVDGVLPLAVTMSPIKCPCYGSVATFTSEGLWPGRWGKPRLRLAVHRWEDWNNKGKIVILMGRFRECLKDCEIGRKIAEEEGEEDCEETVQVAQGRGIREDLGMNRPWPLVPIPAFAWSDFGKPWKIEIRMAGSGVTTAPPRSVRIAKNLWKDCERRRRRDIIQTTTNHEREMYGLPWLVVVEGGQLNTRFDQRIEIGGDGGRGVSRLLVFVSWCFVADLSACHRAPDLLRAGL
ncbi:hypothetical protein PR048_021957 [Dryococelus australis]|uniref:Uncharacterized protein n=1 Tax=Dryococelus australis TaxID=614101 RepID=A0ABQ9GZN3_9NEOP|nr:hypothetical protein PR048_021957 [Dryococelus australis]